MSEDAAVSTKVSLPPPNDERVRSQELEKLGRVVDETATRSNALWWALDAGTDQLGEIIRDLDLEDLMGQLSEKIAEVQKTTHKIRNRVSHVETVESAVLVSRSHVNERRQARRTQQPHN